MRPPGKDGCLRNSCSLSDSPLSQLPGAATPPAVSLSGSVGQDGGLGQLNWDRQMKAGGIACEARIVV